MTDSPKWSKAYSITESFVQRYKLQAFQTLTSCRWVCSSVEVCRIHGRPVKVSPVHSRSSHFAYTQTPQIDFFDNELPPLTQDICLINHFLKAMILTPVRTLIIQPYWNNLFRTELSLVWKSRSVFCFVFFWLRISNWKWAKYKYIKDCTSCKPVLIEWPKTEAPSAKNPQNQAAITLAN